MIPTQHTRIGLSILAALTLGTAARAQQRPLAGFDAYVAKAVTDWRVPGLAIVVVKDDSVVFIKGYGVRELGKPDRVTEHTRFGNMSTTKAFTALLVAMLADSGRLAFDDPVTKHEPAVQFADPYVTREITVRDLLTHRVGFGDPDYLWGNSGLDFAAMVPRLRLVRPTTSFRSRFQYNNVTYALAGDVAAHAAGTSWQSLMHARIYGPLGMSESYPDAKEMQAAGITDVSSPHGIVRDTVRVLPVSPLVTDGIASAGAAFTTATDMGKWLRFLLDSGKVAGRRLVSAQNFAELFRPQQILLRPFYPTANLVHPHFQAYGLGWILQDYRGEFVAMHTGSIEGRSAIVGLLPDRRLGVAILTNLDHAELRHALMYTVFDRFIGSATPAHDWSAEMRPMYKRIADSTRALRSAQESKRVMGTHPTLPLDRYTGTYADSLFGTATVGSNDGRLTFHAGNMNGQLEHWQYDIFRVTWPDPFWDAVYVSFAIDPDGTVGELRVVEGEQVYRRVK
jgi:CubicO group peptidase (beta-lactamase class C family)